MDPALRDALGNLVLFKLYMCGYDISLIPEIYDRLTVLRYRLAPTRNILRILSSTNLDAVSTAPASNVTMLSARTTLSTANATASTQEESHSITTGSRERSSADSGYRSQGQEVSGDQSNDGSYSTSPTSVASLPPGTNSTDRMSLEVSEQQQVGFINDAFVRNSRNSGSEESLRQQILQTYQLLQPGEITIQQTHLHQAAEQQLTPNIRAIIQPNESVGNGGHTVRPLRTARRGGEPIRPHIESIEVHQADVTGELQGSASEERPDVVVVQLPNPNQPAVEEVETPLQTIQQISEPIRGYTELAPTQARANVETDASLDSITSRPNQGERNISNTARRFLSESREILGLLMLMVEFLTSTMPGDDLRLIARALGANIDSDLTFEVGGRLVQDTSVETMLDRMIIGWNIIFESLHLIF